MAPILSVIYQHSLDTGCVPDDWKTANVVPVFKGGEKHDPSNYRPVSLTSIVCKTLEHIVFSNIMDHLEKNSFLTNLQHGFRKQHGCETQLLTVVEDLAKGIDNRSQWDLIILDFQKAFDKVPHSRLLKKLDYCGVKDQTHNWIKNWLTTRTQRVVVDGEQSQLANVTSGVPQGTVLGPLMFTSMTSCWA